jgi:hypothetical protein
MSTDEKGDQRDDGETQHVGAQFENLIHSRAHATFHDIPLSDCVEDLFEWCITHSFSENESERVSMTKDLHTSPCLSVSYLLRLEELIADIYEDLGSCRRGARIH